MCRPPPRTKSTTQTNPMSAFSPAFTPGIVGTMPDYFDTILHMDIYIYVIYVYYIGIKIALEAIDR